jgi:hypothetical protein
MIFSRYVRWYIYYMGPIAEYPDTMGGNMVTTRCHGFRAIYITPLSAKPGPAPGCKRTTGHAVAYSHSTFIPPWDSIIKNQAWGSRNSMRHVDTFVGVCTFFLYALSVLWSCNYRPQQGTP